LKPKNEKRFDFLRRHPDQGTPELERLAKIHKEKKELKIEAGRKYLSSGEKRGTQGGKRRRRKSKKTKRTRRR
jgi:hypothetical protein